uniref:Uncharacterized protein n=1 Tax=Triticum urartu TaxID=4572 RepID=A0A8R7R1X2_TRIUA
MASSPASSLFISGVDALLHLAKELRTEHRRPGRDQAAVRREGLASGLEHHVGALLCEEKVTQVHVKVGWGNGDECRRGGLRRLHRAEVADDDEVAPDGEGVPPEMFRFLQGLRSDELGVPPARQAGEVVQRLRRQRQRLILRLAGEAELVLRPHRPGGVFREDEAEGYVARVLRLVAIGVVEDEPAVASHGERAGLEGLACGDALGARVEVDREVVGSGRRVGDKGGGGPRWLAAGSGCRHG